MKEWYTVAELVGLPGLPSSDRRIRDRAQKYAWSARPRSGKGGGLEYHLSSLPDDAQAALARREAPILPALPAPNPAALPVQPADTAIDPAARKAEGDARAAHLRGNAQARMDAKRDILALVEAAKRAGSKIETAVVDYNAGRIAVNPETRAHFPIVSVPTVYRWAQQINGYGLARLAGRYGHRAGSGIIDTYPQLAAALRAFLIDYPHASAKIAHDWLCARYTRDWAALPAEIAGDGPIPLPSLKTTARWIERWKTEHAELYARLSNPDFWKSKYMIGWGDMSAHLQRPNQVWEFDSTPADVMLHDGRHSILGVIDLYTRRVKLHISKTSRAAAVAHLIKQALLDWGVPAIAKTDNGQDYVANHIKRIFYALGIEHQIAAPFCPWQKPFIERFFRTFSHDLLELLPGYIGHNVADREALRAREQFSDRLFVKSRTVELPGLTAADLQTFADRWTLAYHARPHTGLKGQTPHDRLTAWREPVPRIQDERVLNLLLQDIPGGDGWRVVTKAYGIRVDNQEYIGEDLIGHVGERLRVLYDPEDAGLIYCLDAKDQFIGRAECPELTGTPRQELAARCTTRQRQQIRAVTRDIKREARAIPTRDAAGVLLAALPAPVAFPPPAEPYTTPALTGAAAALEAPTPPPVTEVSAERLAALRDQMAREAAEQAAKAHAEPDHPSAFSCVRWRFEQILQNKVALNDVPDEWKSYAQWYYREEAQDRGRFLDVSLKDFYPQFEQVKAFLLDTGEEDASESQQMAG